MSKNNNNHLYKKHFGQHFLFNPQIHEKIIGFVRDKFIDDPRPMNVIEIGPGAGHLSEAITKILKPKKFLMIERDFDLEKILKQKFNLKEENEDCNQKFINSTKNSEIKLIFDDALKINFEELISREFNIYNEKICLVSNLPYNIATKLILNFFEIQSRVNIFDSITVLIQKEVADRFLSVEPKMKNFGKLGILSNLFFEKVINHFQIGPKNFTPPPKVDSTLISFVKNPNFDLGSIKFSAFMNFLNAAFSSPRKMLLNNLKCFQSDLISLKKVFNELKIKDSARPEEISALKYLKLFENLKNS